MSVENLNQEAKTKISTEGLSEKRRSFLKGSAVTIPAILTLHSGSALAASSLSCIANNHNTPPNPVPDTETAALDKWGRAPSQSVTLSNNVTLFQWPLTTGNWYDATKDTNSTPYYQQGASLNWKLNNSGSDIPANGTITPSFVLVEFDNSGAIIGYGATSPFAGASNSCLTSLAIKA